MKNLCSKKLCLGPGPRIFCLQRISALCLCLALVYFIFFLKHPKDFLAWELLQQSTSFRVWSLVFFLSFGIHAYLGLKIILEDYLKARIYQRLLQFSMSLYLLIAWGILWQWI